MKTPIVFKSLDLLISIVICIVLFPYHKIDQLIALYSCLGIYHILSTFLHVLFKARKHREWSGQRYWYVSIVVIYFCAAFVLIHVKSHVVFYCLAAIPAVLGLWYMIICFNEIVALLKQNRDNQNTNTTLFL